MNLKQLKDWVRMKKKKKDVFFVAVKTGYCIFMKVDQCL